MLNDFEKIHAELREINEQIILLRIDVAQLKVKAGVWGFLAGSVPVIVALAVNYLKGAH